MFGVEKIREEMGQGLYSKSKTPEKSKQNIQENSR